MTPQHPRISAVCLALLTGSTATAWDLKLGEKTASFHGFASQGFLASTDYDYLGRSRDGSFEFNEFGLNTSISPFNRTRITAQAFTFDVGNVGNYELILDYASIEYTVNDHVGFRGGRVRRPGGIYNHIQDVDLARTAILLPQGMYDARWRDFSTSIDGGLVFGSFSLGSGGALSYEAYAGYMNLSKEGGVARILENGLPPAPIGGFSGIDKSLIAGGQLWWNTPVDGLRFGVSGGQVFDFTWHISVAPPFGPGGMKTEVDIPFGQVSLEYQKDGWTFQTEYYTYKTTGFDMLENGMILAPTSSQPDVWYVGLSKRLTPWLELGSYYTEYFTDVDNRGGVGTAVPSDAFQKDAALSARFDITDWWIFKLEGHYIRGTGLLHSSTLNPVRNDDGWWLFAAKTTLSF
jgi:hypothetical protein